MNTEHLTWKGPPKNTELVIGLVAAVGTDLDLVIDKLSKRLNAASYGVRSIHVAKDIIPLVSPIAPLNEGTFKLAMAKMDAGNRAREKAKDNAILALGAASLIFEERPRDDDKDPVLADRQAYIIRSLKHPEEVERLREVYPQGFYLIGVHAADVRRQRFLVDERRMNADDARRLMQRDEDEHKPRGQKVADTFHMADFFVHLDENTDRLTNSLNRIVHILLGDPFKTPTFDEYAMFLAFSASLRSADLSRQVGAVVADEVHREILATGTNDCPRAGGGLYWPVAKDCTIQDEPKGRDFKRGEDPNTVQRNEIAASIISEAADEGIEEAKLLAAIERSKLRDITEYGRVVHAEMEALLSCARNRISTRGASLFCTTFPCHNCGKHIIAAGIRRVVYVEPYPKSKLPEFHDEAILLGLGAGRSSDSCHRKRVLFEPFVGVGPRLFFDMFSMRLGSGRYLARKGEDGKNIDWKLEEGSLRRPMLPYSYIELEIQAARYFDDYQIKESANNGQME